MNKGKQLLIPVPLAKQIVEMLGLWDTSKYDRTIREGCNEMLLSLNIKLHKLEIRDAYANIVAAKNDVDRHDARIHYLWLKSRLDDLIDDGCIF